MDYYYDEDHTNINDYDENIYDEEINRYSPKNKHTESLQIKMTDDLKKIWFNVIVPYINNGNQAQILNNLSENDFHKFYKFMIAKNNTCVTINQLLGD
jgi:hypothetical protein